MFAGENVTLWVKHFLEKTSAVHALIKESTVFQQLPTSAIKVVGRTQHILDMVNQYHQGPAIIALVTMAQLLALLILNALKANAVIEGTFMEKEPYSNFREDAKNVFAAPADGIAMH